MTVRTFFGAFSEFLGAVLQNVPNLMLFIVLLILLEPFRDLQSTACTGWNRFGSFILKIYWIFGRSRILPVLEPAEVTNTFEAAVSGRSFSGV